MLSALEIPGSRPAAEISESIVALFEILSVGFFFFESCQLKFLFCLMPKIFLPDLPSSCPKTYACMKKSDFWKSGYFPNAFNSTEDMKYCAESSGKPTISGMKIPSVND